MRRVVLLYFLQQICYLIKFIFNKIINKFHFLSNNSLNIIKINLNFYLYLNFHHYIFLILSNFTFNHINYLILIKK